MFSYCVTSLPPHALLTLVSTSLIVSILILHRSECFNPQPEWFYIEDPTLHIHTWKTCELYKERLTMFSRRDLVNKILELIKFSFSLSVWTLWS